MDTKLIEEILSDYKADMKNLRFLQGKLLELSDVDKIRSSTATWRSLRTGQAAGNSNDNILIIKEEIEAEIQDIRRVHARLEKAINELNLMPCGKDGQLLINCLYRDGMSTDKTKKRMSIFNPGSFRKLKKSSLFSLQAIYKSAYLDI